MRNYEFKLTPAYCLYNGIAVVSQEGSRISFMTENPGDELLRMRLQKAFSNYVDYVIRQKDCPGEFKLKPSVVFVPGNRKEIKKYVSKLYSMPDFPDNSGEAETIQTKEKDNDAAAVILLDSIISDARSRNATDIHIEKNCIKFRICGKLETVSYISQEKVQEVIQRIKFLAGMNVLEKRRSQDGHFIYGEKDPVFIRVSVMGVVGQDKTEQEESVVIRLLDTRRMPLSLDKLGFSQEQTELISKISEQKNGLVIICGPTGAGKSTTAASILLEIEKQRRGSVKIVSLEDPPEYILPGISQIQVDEKINNSFSEALKHVFRQDPDVLMIGEIRDENSASVAVRAALTGHLVFATLHTACAAGALLRLENLGVPRNLLISVLKCVISQELNFLGQRITLVADVAVPGPEMNEVIDKNLSEQQLEEYFTHTTNYSHALLKILGTLKQKHLQPVPQRKRKILISKNKKQAGEKAV